MINQLHECYLSGESISLSPCLQFRDYIHVTEAAIGIKKLCSVSHTGIVNLGSGNVIQLKNFVELLWQELGIDLNKLKFGDHSVPKNEQIQPKAFADLKKLRKLTNWEPSLSVQNGIKKTASSLLSSR